MWGLKSGTACQHLDVTPHWHFFKFEATELLQGIVRIIDPRFRPAELFQDATLIFKNYWNLLFRNHIPFSWLPLHLYMKFSPKVISGYSPFEFHILANSCYLSRSKWSCTFHSFCYNVTLGTIGEETNWNFPAHQTPRAKWIASVYSLERKVKGYNLFVFTLTFLGCWHSNCLMANC